ncbi:LysM domain-containing protein, partial [Oceanospirillum sp. HFRX-1_2]
MNQPTNLSSRPSSARRASRPLLKSLLVSSLSFALMAGLSGQCLAQSVQDAGSAIASGYQHSSDQNNQLSFGQSSIRTDAPKHYEVKAGDTLWDISALFLKDPWMWPQLWRENPQVENPDLIYPGDRLALIFDQQGQPRLERMEPGVV